MIPEQSAGSDGDLWFRQRPRLAVVVAAALFIGVFALRLGTGGPNEAYSMFYVLPIALLAVTFGVRGGVLGGLTAVLLIVAWALYRDVHLGALAWTARVVPMLALGLLLGHSTSRAQRAENRQRELEPAALLHEQAIEINDSLVQGLASARWALDQGRVDDGLKMLDATMSQAQGKVSGLIRRAGMGARTSR
jgi:glucose-6-phosphate-specific signal transduction histidine kinase